MRPEQSIEVLHGRIACDAPDEDRVALQTKFGTQGPTSQRSRLESVAVDAVRNDPASLGGVADGLMAGSAVRRVVDDGFRPNGQPSTEPNQCSGQNGVERQIVCALSDRPDQWTIKGAQALGDARGNVGMLHPRLNKARSSGGNGPCEATQQQRTGNAAMAGKFDHGSARSFKP